MSNLEVDNTYVIEVYVDVNIFNSYKTWIGPLGMSLLAFRTSIIIYGCPHTMKSKRAYYSKNIKIYLSPLRI